VLCAGWSGLHPGFSLHFEVLERAKARPTFFDGVSTGMARIGYLGVMLSAASFLVSAQQTRPPQPQDLSHYTLGPDDQIKIWALGVEEITDKPVRIGPSGDLDLPLIGKVHALGMTVEELSGSPRRF
jgi:protein involved in polysaccharide export with SLBB domain